MKKRQPLISRFPETVIFAIALLLPLPLHAQDGAAPESGASNGAIKWSGGGLSVELTALTPDLTRAFFIGRGFPKKDVELLAMTACVFRSAIGHAIGHNNAQASVHASVDANVGPEATSGKPTSRPVTIQLDKWRVHRGGKSHPVRTREAWHKIWEKRELNASARTAFHWALIPTEQTYEPTDYNWGMLTFMEPAGTKFDLQIAWLEGDKSRTHQIKNLRCGKGEKE